LAQRSSGLIKSLINVSFYSAASAEVLETPPARLPMSRRVSQLIVPIHPKLLAHVRRWKRKGISKTAVVEFRGKPVATVTEAWRTIAEQASFSTEKSDPCKLVRHSLRHTAITWFLTGLHNREQPVVGSGRRPGKGIDIEVVSQYCGVSPATIRKHYRHETANTYDELLGRRSG